MGDAGILPRLPRVELLDGEIIRMSPFGPRHCRLVDKLTEMLVPRLVGRAICRVHGAIALDPHSEPQPDLVLLKTRRDGYGYEHPVPGSILLVVEVSESSISYDLSDKLRNYALAEIPEYWVFDLNRDKLMVHRDPAGDSYADVKEYGVGDRISSLAFPDVVLDLGPILTF